LPGGGKEQVCPADDVGNALGHIIGHDGQLVGKQAIKAAKDKIANL
jgi:hypothetical protein